MPLFSDLGRCVSGRVACSVDGSVWHTEAEVGELHANLAARNNDVLGLDVPVNKAAVLEHSQGLHELPRHAGTDRLPWSFTSVNRSQSM